MNILFLDYLILLVFNSYELIRMSDKLLLFRESGSKLTKYIQSNVQQKSTCSLDNCDKKYLYSYFKLFTISLKYYFKVILIDISILLFKVSLTFKYIYSNFLYIRLFNKNIDIVSLLEEKYIFFVIIYYIFSFNYILIISLKINKRIRNNNNQENKIELNDKVFLGVNAINKEPIYLNYSGLYQNLLITGSIGSGKTSSGISNILDGLIKNNISGLVLDIKGNYVETLKNIANKYGKNDKTTVISMDNDFKYNPLNKPELSSLELANYMIRVLKVLSKGNNSSDPFWLDKAESYIRDFITIIRVYNDGFVNFKEIHKLVTNNDYIEQKIETIKNRILNNEFEDEKIFEISSAINNIKNEYLKLDERIIGIIKSEITRITNIFVTDYKIYDKFCTNNTKLDFFDDKVVILSINIGENRFLSKVISTYLKFDFQQQVFLRKNPQKPVFFVCDEFQEIANIEDSNFFSLSREYKAINIISMQSYNSLINALQDEKSANVIIQNLVNKVWYRNDDTYTIKEIINQIGKEKRNIETMSYSETGHNSRFSLITKKFKDYKTGLSKSYSINIKDEYRISEEYITSKLDTFEAICFLSDGMKIKIYDKVKLKRWGDDYE